MAFSMVSGEIQYEITAQLLLHCQVGRTDFCGGVAGSAGVSYCVSFHHLATHFF
jgi:hypothetical protein